LLVAVQAGESLLGLILGYQGLVNTELLHRIDISEEGSSRGEDAEGVKVNLLAFGVIRIEAQHAARSVANKATHSYLSSIFKRSVNF
jgi:hypothetical protein